MSDDRVILPREQFEQLRRSIEEVVNVIIDDIVNESIHTGKNVGIIDLESYTKTLFEDIVEKVNKDKLIKYFLNRDLKEILTGVLDGGVIDV